MLLSPMLSPEPRASETIEGLATLDLQGNLRVGGRAVSLFGIEIAPSQRFCRTYLRPVRCGPRALLFLDDLLEGFVHCRVVGPADRRIVAATCSLRGERLFDDRTDIASRLLIEGWAFARPEAPFIYQKLEDVARSRGVGVWRDDFRFLLR